jgi:ribosomal protein L9
MQVILIEPVQNLGLPGDVVSVKAGYARNFLLPSRMALPATEGRVKEMAHARRIAESRRRKLMESLKGRAEALDGVRLEFEEKVTETGKLYGSVSARRIAEELAHDHGVDVAVDNTFASPYLQKPLDLGADLVLHSTTKYLGGHSDLIGGAVCTSDETWHERMRFQLKSAGAVAGPQDCFLALRGTKTLHLRMEAHCENAAAVAELLNEHPAVAKTYYPGLPDHEGHELAARQMDGFGGMVSFTLVDDRMETARTVLSGTEVFALAESLGGVESLIGHPATMTHASIPAEERREIGITDSLIRLSVGIEDQDDLVEDLQGALDSVA